MVREGRVQMRSGRLRPRVHHLTARELAVEVRDLLLVRAPGDRLELLGNADRFLPVFFLLIDLEEELERLLRMSGPVQLQEQLFRAIEQPGFEIVLRELEKRRALLVFLQIGPLDEVLMHADRPLDFPTPAKEAAEREMKLHCLWIDFHDFDESFDRLVGLLVQEKVEPFEIGHRQCARLRHELLDVDARGKPAQREKQREREQPPVFDIHSTGFRARAHGPTTSGRGGSRPGSPAELTLQR